MQQALGVLGLDVRSNTLPEALAQALLAEPAADPSALLAELTRAGALSL